MPSNQPLFHGGDAGESGFDCGIHALLRSIRFAGKRNKTEGLS